MRNSEADTFPKGKKSRTRSETGLKAAGGIRLFGKGWPVAKLTSMFPVLGSCKPEKSPCRSCGVGTVAVFVIPCRFRKPSQKPKKKS